MTAPTARAETTSAPAHHSIPSWPAGWGTSQLSAAVVAMAQAPADFAIVDVDLPDMDGADVVRAVRRATDAPLIVVSTRAAEIDRITALDAGADDYVVKPLSVAELMARVRAVARR